MGFRCVAYVSINQRDLQPSRHHFIDKLLENARQHTSSKLKKERHFFGRRGELLVSSSVWELELA
jgi:hypothetical protein